MPIVVLTGANSGLGRSLVDVLGTDYDVIGISRRDVDLDNIQEVVEYDLPYCDYLINCAAHDLGGKVPFTDHDSGSLVKVMTTNLLSPVVLTQKALRNNACCKIVNITSTNNNRFWPGDLGYSLSKLSLHNFTEMVRVEHPLANVLEVRVGLMKTNFNNNRYKGNHAPMVDLYGHNDYLEPSYVASKIANAINDNTVKFIEVSP